jgi:hypothetical protein
MCGRPKDAKARLVEQMDRYLSLHDALDAVCRLSGIKWSVDEDGMVVVRR